MTRFPQQFLLLLSLLFAACTTTPEYYEAANLSQKPFNQIELAGNACGPAALLNSYRFGNPKWRKLSEEPAGLTDRERMRSIARGPAMRMSASLPGRARWSYNGINLSDLRDVANELSAPDQLPYLSQEMLFLKSGETQQAHLARTHSLFSRSLRAGIPPILSIRRFAKKGEEWDFIQGHYVTIVSVPGKIDPKTGSFPVRYIDPWGGKFKDGHITIRETAFLSKDPARNANLEADFPSALVGKSLVAPGQETMLASSAVIGHF